MTKLVEEMLFLERILSNKQLSAEIIHKTRVRLIELYKLIYDLC